MVNECTFVGWLTQKPSLIRISSEKQFVKFTLAVDRKYPNHDGEWVTDYIDFIAWNKFVEKICKYEKGDLIAASGSLQNHTTVDKDGNKCVEAQIVVEYCRKVPSKKNTKNDVSRCPSPSTSQREKFEDMEDDDKNLPF